MPPIVRSWPSVRIPCDACRNPPTAGFDPATFGLLAQKYDGFYRFPAGSNHQYNETLFFGDSLFCAL